MWKEKLLEFYLENIDKVKTVKWTSSNHKIATVKQNGEIVAKEVGNVKIKCITTNENGNIFKFEVVIMVKDTKKHLPWEPALNTLYNIQGVPLKNWNAEIHYIYTFDNIMILNTWEPILEVQTFLLLLILQK